MIYDWFCPGTSTMFMNKALVANNGMVANIVANNSLERKFQLD